MQTSTQARPKLKLYLSLREAVLFAQFWLAGTQYLLLFQAVQLEVEHHCELFKKISPAFCLIVFKKTHNLTNQCLSTIAHHQHVFLGNVNHSTALFHFAWKIRIQSRLTKKK